MGAIREVSTGQVRFLEPEYLVGRAPVPQCSLSLVQAYVSGLHAVLRWSGDIWELKDLGSLNGTFIDGRRIKPTVVHRVQKGSRIGFGRVECEWELTDDRAPQVMAVPIDGGEPVRLDGELLALPSPDDPRATIYRDGRGVWVLEQPDTQLFELENKKTFESGGRIYRFCCYGAAQPTLAASRTDTSQAELEFRNVTLVFGVSRDESYVHLAMICGDQRFDMGARDHNYLLLTLARQRLADEADGLPDTSCGWIHQEDIAHDPSMAPPRLNTAIFRIREQFGKMGIIDPVNVVERRIQTRQLRLGTGCIRVVSL